MLIDRYIEREELRELLKEVYDLERLSGKIAFGNANARDLIQLKKSLEKIPEIRTIVASLGIADSEQIKKKLILVKA